MDPELDEGVYEVELKTAFGEFDYLVDAFTGAVLSGPKDVLNYAPGGGQADPSASGAAPEGPASSGQDMGRDAALAAALLHAGLTQDQISGLEIERDWDDGRLEYEIDFWCGTDEYGYTIDGHTCSVLKHELDHHPRQQGTHHGGASSSAGVSLEEAKAAALSHAGLQESQVWDMKAEQDWDDNRLEYEVEFRSGGMKYEYTIDGATGGILSSERERDD